MVQSDHLSEMRETILHHVTSDVDLLMKLEAPPGFEPGVKVLQT
jgi:hypothetical protein